MMTLNKAKRLALAGLARLSERPSEERHVVDELTQCRRLGWVFFCESRTVVVTHAGAFYALDTARPIEDVLRELEETLRRGRATP